MPMAGSTPLPPKPLAKAWPLLLGLLAMAPTLAQAQQRDTIATSLTGAPGDAARGRAIVGNRQVGLCLLCHAGPFPAPHLHGSIGPTLDGIGDRLSPGQIRLRLVDSRRVNPDTVMPAYLSTAGLNRVGAAWSGKPILTETGIEDVVAFLTTLRTTPGPSVPGTSPRTP